MAIGAIAVAAVLTLLVPKAAHAVVATLVQVSNTIAAPAITQGVPNLASQMVSISDSIGPGLGLTVNGFVSYSPQALVLADPYITPSTQNLVITSIQFSPVTPDPGKTLELTMSNGPGIGALYADWRVPCDSITTIQFPTGLVIGPGVQLALEVISGGSTKAAFNVSAQGYLTAN